MQKEFGLMDQGKRWVYFLSILVNYQYIQILLIGEKLAIEDEQVNDQLEKLGTKMKLVSLPQR